MKRRSSLLMPAALCAAGMLFLAACGSTPTTHTSSKPSLLQDDGPFAHLHWTAGRLHSGDLLHDDGETLWRIRLDGHKTPIWRHRRVNVYEFAAAPGGSELAYTIQTGQHTYLYELTAHGSARLVDEIGQDGGIETPTFLHAPTDPHGPLRLYWVRSRQDVRRSDNRFASSIMTASAGRPTAVSIDLREGEAPWALSAYPGSRTFALSLARTDNAPTRLEILLNQDFYRAATDASVGHWALFQDVAQTDSPDPIAWLSPSEFIVPLSQSEHRSFELRLFKLDCTYQGSRIVYRGPQIADWSQFAWPMLPISATTLLVLRKGSLTDSGTRWQLLDIRTTRALRATRIGWQPGGWWTVVEAPKNQLPPTHQPSCAGFDTYP